MALSRFSDFGRSQERIAIEQWLQDHPEQTPTGWPQEISYQRSSLGVSRPHQIMIDRILRKLLDDAKRSADLLT